MASHAQSILEEGPALTLTETDVTTNRLVETPKVSMEGNMTNDDGNKRKRKKSSDAAIAKARPLAELVQELSSPEVSKATSGKLMLDNKTLP